MAKEKKPTILESFKEVEAFLKDVEAPEDLLEFVAGRIEQAEKAAESAKASRLKKTGGEKKDVTQSDFYVGLRDKIYPVLTVNAQVGDELLGQIDNVTPNGKEYLAAQIAVALRPLVEDGTVIVGKKKVEFVDKQGLKKETLRTSYQLA